MLEVALRDLQESVEQRLKQVVERINNVTIKLTEKIEEKKKCGCSCISFKKEEVEVLKKMAKEKIKKEDD